MKIYVSDKEIDDNVLNYVEDDFVEEYFLSRGMSKGKGFEIYDHVGLVEIQSLEQHEQEIRKPLEDEIEKLRAQQFKLAVRELEELELGVILERGAIMGCKQSEQFKNGFDKACFRMENQIKKMTEDLKQKLKEIKE